MRAILFILGLTFAVLPSYAQDGCVMKTDKDGIKVYTCEVKDSKFKAVKATFELNASLSEFGAAVMDIKRYSEWQYKTLSVEVLKNVSEHELIYYTEVAAPVLTSNRDFVIQLMVSQNKQTKEVIADLVSLPNYIPAKDGIIRVPFSKARYTVKAISPSLLSVDYYIEINLGGSVPAWMVNMVAPQAPFETFKGLQKIIGSYKGKGVSFISN